MIMVIKFVFILAWLSVLNNRNDTIIYFLLVPRTQSRTRAGPELLSVSLVSLGLSFIQLYLYQVLVAI